MTNRNHVLIALTLLLSAVPAHAYVGPGAGLGTVVVVLGVLASVVMGILSLVWYPLKRFLKRSRKSVSPPSEDRDKPDPATK